MGRIPEENIAYLLSQGVSAQALEIHQTSCPLDTHTDSMTVSWLFGIDLCKNQRQIWKPRKRLLRYTIFTTLIPQGNHKPLLNHSDLPRMIDGGFAGACFSAHAHLNNLHLHLGDPWPQIVRQYQYLVNLADRQDSPLAIATTPKEFRTLAAEGKIAAMFGLEGVHCLGTLWPWNRQKRLARLEQLRKKYGAACVTVNHYSSNDVAAASLSAWKTPGPEKGVGPFAEEFVSTANRLGLVLDLSHTNRQGILDIAGMSSKPVIASHAGVYEIAEELSPGGKYNRRMLDVESIKAIASTGGCVGVMFNPYFLHGTQKDGPMDLLVKHYNRLRSEVGPEHVCLGTDFDGMIASIPLEMRDAADLPLFTQKLLDAGWTEQEIKGLYCDNFLRVWEDNLRT